AAFHDSGSEIAGWPVMLNSWVFGVAASGPCAASSSARSRSGRSGNARAVLARLIDDGAMNLRALRDELERTALELALDRAGDSPAGAARLLGEVGRGSSRDPGGTVRAMLRRHGLAHRASASRRAARQR